MNINTKGHSKSTLSSLKKGQVTIFIIVAIVLVVGVVAYFALRGGLSTGVPEDMRPVYDYYISCLEETAREGVSLLGEQGGYIEVPEFEAGSAYIPFSNQLSFFGQAVPYWMYVSGNNFLKEQVPKKKLMESQLNDYVEERLTSCDFSDFEAMGYDVYVEAGSVASSISENKISVGVSNKINIFKDDRTVSVSSHDFSLSSKLGKFYNMALDVYDNEKETMFLENYALDVMRMYAPVDGVDLSCAPRIFVDEVIRKGLYEGLDVNMNSIKLKGDYYKLASEEGEYFVKDVGFDVDENVNVMYNTQWPTKIEIYGDRVAKPVGTQPGLSALGFCYVPYHLVYDISFPVMIQFYDEKELFQFPVSVVIDNSQAREALPSTFGGVDLNSEVCRYENADLTVYTYDAELEPVEARIQFKCLDSVCEIGETRIAGLSENSELRTQNSEEAVYKGTAPQCVNGFVVASADGYATEKYQISTNSESVANIVLRKEYSIPINFVNSNEVSGIRYQVSGIDSAVVSFTGEDYSKTVLYPEMKSVTLIEGEYDVSVYVYESSSLTFDGYSERMCVDVPVSGFGGLIGLEEEKCYDVDVPSMEISMAVVGGGKTVEYIPESLLRDSDELNINVPLFGKPSSLDSLQENYEKAETSTVFLEWE